MIRGDKKHLRAFSEKTNKMETTYPDHWDRIQRFISDNERYKIIQQYFEDNPDRLKLGKNKRYLEQVDQKRARIIDFFGKDPERLSVSVKIVREEQK